MASGHINDLRLRIFGSRGGIDARFEKGKSELFACLEPDLETCTWQTIDAPDVQTNYARFIDAVRNKTQVLPDFARGATLQSALDLAVVSDGDQQRSQQITAKT